MLLSLLLSLVSLPSMCIGEKRKLIIPPDLGYGDRGAPPKIPGDTSLSYNTRSVRITIIVLFFAGGATLVFEVELLDIERSDEL